MKELVYANLLTQTNDIRIIYTNYYIIINTVTNIIPFLSRIRCNNFGSVSERIPADVRGCGSNIYISSLLLIISNVVRSCMVNVYAKNGNVTVCSSETK